MKKNNKDKFKIAMQQIEKMYGKGIVQKFNDKKKIIPEDKIISTGSIKIDYVTGIGGVPRGRVTEIFGTEMGGKSTLCLQVIATAQKNGGEALYIDVEHALDIDYAKKLGVDTSKLMISQPDSAEQALNVGEKLLMTGKFDIIVLDSVAALVPQKELDGDMGDAQVAVQARLMSQALRKLTSKVANTNTAFIFINQIRKKIGIMFGNPETTTGGNALKFYASMRIDIRRIGAIKSGENIIGNKTKVVVVKNKLAPPFKKTEVAIIFGKGVDPFFELIEVAIDLKIMKKKKGWIIYKGKHKEYKLQGIDKWVSLLESKPKLFNIIKRKVVGI